MFESLFITYANNPFYENPDNIHKVADAIIPSLGEGHFVDNIKKTFDLIYEFSIDPKKANNYLRTYDPGFLAYEAVFLYRDGYCEDGYYGKEYPKDKGRSCYEPLEGIYKEILSNNSLGNVRLKCHECRQFQFIKTLEVIISENPCEEWALPIKIRDYAHSYRRSVFNEIFYRSYDYIRKVNRFNENGEIVVFEDFNLSRALGDNTYLIEDTEYSHRRRFNGFLLSLVGYSLMDFLIKNDPRRLIKCEWCGDFKVKKRTSKKGTKAFCSELCKNGFHRQLRSETKYHTEYMKEYRKL